MGGVAWGYAGWEWVECGKVVEGVGRGGGEGEAE